VLVTAANSYGRGVALSPQTAAVTGGVAPTATAAPAIFGVPRIGQALAASSGGWSGSSPIGFQYAWQRCRTTCASISGATKSTYVPAAADVGASLRVLVTASNPFGKSTASSPLSAAVLAAPPTSTTAPAISGTPTTGKKLTASHGTWAGGGTITYEYLWLRCTTWCAAIAGATSSTYVATSADAGSKLRVLIWATNAAGRGAAYSTLTATIT
jgi:hypothetical protein